jgi:organic radical activating enzyme
MPFQLHASSCVTNVDGGELCAAAEARRTEAVSAGADAGAAVPLQSGVRGLREDSVSGARAEARAFAGRVLKAVDECGAPMVSIPGGEPLMHPQIGEIVEGLVARKKYIYLCTNALLLKEKIICSSPASI